MGEKRFFFFFIALSLYRERAMELKLTGIALNRPKNHIGGKKYTTEVKWMIFIKKIRSYF